MRIPKRLKVGDIIGICAPSAGINKPEKQIRLDEAIKRLEALGFKVVESESVRNDIDGRSASKEIRAKEFMDLYLNPDISAIIFASGGDFLVEMLDFVDFEEIRNADAKWLVGYSDITGINLPITTITDTATLYSQTIKDFAIVPLHRSLEDTLNIMMGTYPVQNSFDKCEKKVDMNNFIEEINNVDEEEDGKEINPNEGYKLEEDVVWKNLYDEDIIEISGRAIGGCLDLIKNILGTKFDKTKDFIEKYKEDGIVWFFDIFESSTPELVRTMWQMKNAGYFDYCKGILVGRSLILREDYDIDLSKAFKQGLDGLDIPVIYDMDIGHVSPQLPIIIGGKIIVKSSGGKGTLESYLD